MDTINNIEWCRELWNINLTGNRVIAKWIDRQMDEQTDKQMDG